MSFTKTLVPRSPSGINMIGECDIFYALQTKIADWYPTKPPHPPPPPPPSGGSEAQEEEEEDDTKQSVLPANVGPLPPNGPGPDEPPPPQSEPRPLSPVEAGIEYVFQFSAKYFSQHYYFPITNMPLLTICQAVHHQAVSMVQMARMAHFYQPDFQPIKRLESRLAP